MACTTTRSAITNGKRLHDGVDGRSKCARRFRDLVGSSSTAFGGMARLSEAERSLVRQAAALTVRAESLQARVVRGDDVNHDELIRLASEARRALQGIRAREAPKASLSDYLAQRGQAA